MAIQDEYIKTALRLPRHLHADLLVDAQNAGRSMNAEIIDRLSKSSDLGHLHRVIEQLSQTMREEREGSKHQMGMILMMFDKAIGALDECLLFAQHKNATSEDIQRLRSEITHARSIVKAFKPMSTKPPFDEPPRA